MLKRKCNCWLNVGKCKCDMDTTIDIFNRNWQNVGVFPRIKKDGIHYIPWTRIETGYRIEEGIEIKKQGNNFKCRPSEKLVEYAKKFLLKI